jgi:hypothetical protein
MKFRMPEIFLGAFLAVAIFAMGMLFASSLTPQVQNTAPQQTAEHQAANKINTDSDKAQSLWVPTDSVGLYTLVLAVFTGLLVAVSTGQGYFLLRADKTARIAANAADLSAKAAIAIQLPIIRIVPDRIGWGSSQDGDGPRIEYCAIGNLTFSNLGPTKAFPIEVQLGWTVGDKLPDVPTYTFTKPFKIDTIFEPDPKTPFQLWINDFEITLAVGDTDRIMRKQVKLWLYCCVVYLDFMQTRHEAGLCWVRYETFGGGGFLADPTPAYNRKT